MVNHIIVARCGEHGKNWIALNGQKQMDSLADALRDIIIEPVEIRTSDQAHIYSSADILARKLETGGYFAEPHSLAINSSIKKQHKTFLLDLHIDLVRRCKAETAILVTDEPLASAYVSVASLKSFGEELSLESLRHGEAYWLDFETNEWKFIPNSPNKYHRFAR